MKLEEYDNRPDRDVFDQEIVEDLNLVSRTNSPIRSGGEKGDKSNFLKNFGN